MPYRDKNQYKVIGGKSRDNNIEATYEYTSGNKVSKKKQKQRD